MNVEDKLTTTNHHTETRTATTQTGAMFSSENGEPVHATSQSMTASKMTGMAKFVGKARLWQGANLVEAPQITFDKERRNLTADGQSASNQVQTAFGEPDNK